MTDGVYLLTIYWLLSVTALAVFILVLHTQLHRTSTIDVSLQIKAIIFGASIFDIVSLCLVGITLLGGWYINNEVETAEYCASFSWPECLITVHLMVIVFMLVWLRYVLLLKDAKLPVERFVLDRAHFSGDQCLKVIINGPCHWFIVPVLVSLFLAVLAIQSGIIGSDLDEFTLCVTGSPIHWSTMVICFVYLTILWAFVTVMTTNILKEQQIRHDDNILYIVSDTVDRTRSSSEMEKSSNNDKIQMSTQMPLFLSMSSIWLAPVQCMSMIAILDLEAITKILAIFLTLVYSCLLTTLSLILSVCVCCSLWTNNQGVHVDIIGTVATSTNQSNQKKNPSLQ